MTGAGRASSSVTERKLVDFLGTAAAVVALVLVLLPAVLGLSSGYELRRAVSRLVGCLATAQQRAQSESNQYIVSFDFANGFVTVIDDDNNNGIVEFGERQIGPLLLGADVGVRDGSGGGLPAGRAVFMPDGTVRPSVRIVLSDARGRVKTVRVDGPTGKISAS